MIGMDSKTGKTLGGEAHIKQSIRDILTTAIGTRVELLEYGSELPNLVDRPMNNLLTVEVFAEIAKALAKWEPRFVLNAVRIEGMTQNGRMTIGIDGTSRESGQVIRLEGVTL